LIDLSHLRRKKCAIAREEKCRNAEVLTGPAYCSEQIMLNLDKNSAVMSSKNKTGISRSGVLLQPEDLAMSPDGIACTMPAHS
jgi:hypothetical protein